MIRLLSMSVLGLTLVACSAKFEAKLSSVEPATTPQSGVEAATTQPDNTAQAVIGTQDGFIFAPLPGKSITGAGLTINSNVDVRLVGASIEGASVELHTMSMDDGKMRMRQVDGFDVKAGQPFDLGDSGPHLMVYGLEDVGSGVTVVLEFVDQSDVSMTFPADLTLRKR